MVKPGGRVEIDIPDDLAGNFLIPSITADIVGIKSIKVKGENDENFYPIDYAIIKGREPRVQFDYTERTLEALNIDINNPNSFPSDIIMNGTDYSHEPGSTIFEFTYTDQFNGKPVLNHGLNQKEFNLTIPQIIPFSIFVYDDTFSYLALSTDGSDIFQAYLIEDPENPGQFIISSGLADRIVLSVTDGDNRLSNEQISEILSEFKLLVFGYDYHTGLLYVRFTDRNVNDSNDLLNYIEQIETRIRDDLQNQDHRATQISYYLSELGPHNNQ